MSVYNLILKRRTIRKFKQKKINFSILKKCVDAARLAPSGANLQPLEFLIVDKKDFLDKVFLTLSWAGYLKNFKIEKNERPVAYIILLINRRIRPVGGEHDSGTAAENICLTALEKNIGSCILGSVDREKLRILLKIPKDHDIELVVALGYAAEKSKTEKFKGSVEYWKDEKGVMHIPKRELKNILHRNFLK